jgi:hypothetical protein
MFFSFKTWKSDGTRGKVYMKPDEIKEHLEHLYNEELSFSIEVYIDNPGVELPEEFLTEDKIEITISKDNPMTMFTLKFTDTAIEAECSFDNRYSPSVIPYDAINLQNISINKIDQEYKSNFIKEYGNYKELFRIRKKTKTGFMMLIKTESPDYYHHITHIDHYLTDVNLYCYDTYNKLESMLGEMVLLERKSKE